VLIPWVNQVRLCGAALAAVAARLRRHEPDVGALRLGVLDHRSLLCAVALQLLKTLRLLLLLLLVPLVAPGVPAAAADPACPALPLLSVLVSPDMKQPAEGTQVSTCLIHKLIAIDGNTDVESFRLPGGDFEYVQPPLLLRLLLLPLLAASDHVAVAVWKSCARRCRARSSCTRR